MTRALCVRVGLILVVSPLVRSASPAPTGLSFKDVTKAAGIDFVHVTGARGHKYPVETMGAGAVFFDYDVDGDPDLYLVQSGPLPGDGAPLHGVLYRNDEAGRFTDVTRESGLVDEGYGMGAVAGDYDCDGDPDLYATHWGRNRLFRNEGDGTFTDVTAEAGVGNALWSASAAWADLDADGDLDLYVTNYMDWSIANNPQCWHRGGPRPLLSYCLPDAFRGQPDALYRNDGDGTFTEVGKEAGIALPTGKGLGVVVLDEDQDGKPDIYVANDTVPNFLFRNLGRLRFAEQAVEHGVAYDGSGNAKAGMGVDAADVDLDGDLDLLVTNFQGESSTLYRKDRDGFFTDVSLAAGIAAPSLDRTGWGTAFADLDNDSLPDLVVANGQLDSVNEDESPQAQPNQVFRNLGAGRFQEGDPAGGGFDLVKVSRGLAVADMDGDGDLDLLFTNSGDRPDLLRNDTPRANSLRLLLVGRQANRDALGTRVVADVGGARLVAEVKAGSSYLSQNERIVHLGLGSTTEARDFRIRWPWSAAEESVGTLAANQLVVVVEGLGAVAALPLRH